VFDCPAVSESSTVCRNFRVAITHKYRARDMLFMHGI